MGALELTDKIFNKCMELANKEITANDTSMINEIYQDGYRAGYIRGVLDMAEVIKKLKEGEE